MAWSIVGVGGLTTAASGNLTPSEPAGVQEGDLLVACIAYRSNAAFSVPSGWTKIEEQNTGDTNATNGIASCMMAYIVRGSSAPALTFTRTGGDVGMIRIMAYRGNHSSPLGVHSSNTLASNSGTNTTASLTTSAANSLIVAMSAAGDNLSHTAFDAATDPSTASASTPDTTTAPTAGQWLERADTGTATGADCGLAIADAVRATAGATGTIQCTVSTAARHAMAACEFLIAPASINGTFAGTIDNVTLAADGDLTIQGAVAATIDPVTANSTGSLTIEGDTNTAIGDVTMSGTGALTIQGAVAATIDPITMSATGQGGEVQPINGTFAGTIADVTMSGTGALTINAAVSAQVAPITMNGAGSVTIRGTIAAPIGVVGMTGVGDVGEPSNNDTSVVNRGWRGRFWPGNGKASMGAGLWRTTNN